MTARINTSGFITVHMLSLLCVFLGGVGIAGVVGHFAGMFGYAGAASCSSCLVTSTPAIAHQSTTMNACTPLATSEPLLPAVNHAIMPPPDTQLLARQVLQTDADNWQRLPVRF
jgi:hypothetical protein